MLTRLGDSQQSLTGIEAVLDLRYVQIGSTTFDTRYVLKTGDTMTGQLNITNTPFGGINITGQSPTGSFINTTATQFSDAGFLMYSSISSLGNNAGVHLATNIIDAGVTNSNFAIDQFDYQGNFVKQLFVIDLNAAVTTLTTPLQLGGNIFVPYGNMYSVGQGENWASGTHSLIYTHFTSTDQVDYYTPGNTRSTSIFTMKADATTYTNTDVLLGAAVTPSGNGALQTKVGSSTSPAKVGGVIFDHFGDAGNTTTGETDLYSDTTVANTLAANGDKITAEYAGIFVASGTATRDIRAYFAGTSIFDSTGLTTATAEAWSLKITIIRESATVIRSIVTFIATTAVGASVNTDVQYNRTTGLTLTGTNILKITGQAGGVGAATNDIVAKLGTILFMPGA